MFAELTTYIRSIESENWTPAPERLQMLETLVRYIRDQRKAGKPVRMIYVCTHNSRRSHFGQVWGQVAAQYYGLDRVATWSGGTEATAFNPNAIQALNRAGFRISKSEGPSPNNAMYSVSYDEHAPAVRCYSKVFDDPANPVADFAAIMTCTDAEKNCPVIPGAQLRVGLSYEDPRHFDQTPEQESAYDNCCRSVAREALWIFSQVANGN